MVDVSNCGCGTEVAFETSLCNISDSHDDVDLCFTCMSIHTFWLWFEIISSAISVKFRIQLRRRHAFVSHRNRDRQYLVTWNHQNHSCCFQCEPNLSSHFFDTCSSLLNMNCSWCFFLSPLTRSTELPHSSGDLYSSKILRSRLELRPDAVIERHIIKFHPLLCMGM